MPDYPHIDRYYSDLAELIESDNELNIRPAIQNCLELEKEEKSVGSINVGRRFLKSMTYNLGPIRSMVPIAISDAPLGIVQGVG